MGLIVPQTIRVRVNGRTRKHYKEKGYKFNKCGEFIEVNVLDLPKSSHEMVKIICDVCGNTAEILYRDFIGNRKKGTLVSCGKESCGKKKSEDTCIKRYKVKHSLQSKEVRDKGIQTLKEKYGEDITNAFQATEVKEQIKQTNSERYGCSCVLQSEEIRKKIKETNNKKYGVDCYTQTEEYKDKARKTCQLHYGVDNPSQSQEIKDKKVETCRKHFGVDHPFQSNEVQDKCIKTLKEKYGKDIINVSQLKEIQDKIKITSQERYGVDNPAQSKIVQDKIKATNLERYGRTCLLHTEEARKKAKETMRERYGVEHAFQNKELLDKALDSLQFNGTGPSSRAQRYICYLLGGILNKHMCGSLVDIYMEKENIVIEHDGSGHFLNDIIKGNLLPTKESLLYEKQREDEIINNGHKMIRFIATKDRIPSDKVILNLINGFKNFEFKVIRINFEEGTIDRDYKEKWYCNFGELRRISQKDLDKFEKQEKDTSEN